MINLGVIPTIIFNHRSVQETTVSPCFLRVFCKRSLERMGKLPLDSMLIFGGGVRIMGQHLGVSKTILCFSVPILNGSSHFCA